MRAVLKRCALTLLALYHVCAARAAESSETVSTSSSLVCADPHTTGGCTACDACCKDLSASECGDCIADSCDTPHRCVAEDDKACNVCAECCDKSWIHTQHACDACVNATCDAPAGVCEDHGTKEHPVKCSSECWNSCVWVWLPSLSAPCLDECTASPLFIIALSCAGVRLLEYVLAALWANVLAAVGCSDDDIQERLCKERFCKRCAKMDREYSVVDESDEHARIGGVLPRSESAVAATSALTHHLATMGLLRSVASQRATMLVKNGYTTVEEFEALSNEELKESGDFKEGDLSKVARFRNQAPHQASVEVHVNVPPEPIAQCSVGAVVWVKDGDDKITTDGYVPDHRYVPWIRGKVEQHDPASGKPMVRAIQGRLKMLRFGKVENDYARIEESSFWTLEETVAPRVWDHHQTTPPGFTFGQLIVSGSSWLAAQQSNDYTCTRAIVFGTTKLLLWHVMQPALYFYVFLSAYPNLDPAQRWLGGLFGLKEALYLLVVLGCVVVNPAFLLVDVHATVRSTAGIEGPSFLLTYVLVPHFYVGWALFSQGGLNWEREPSTYAACLPMTLGFAGFLALCAGVRNGNLPMALVVGYTVGCMDCVVLVITILSKYRDAYRNMQMSFVVGVVLMVVLLVLCGLLVVVW